MYKWVEIDLDAITNNYKKIRGLVKEETKILSVVKGDAYGHGLIAAARELVQQGTDYLGVTEVSEGVQLREAGLDIPILVFGPLLPEDLIYLRDYDLTVTLSSIEMLNNIITEKIRIKAHIKIETGLGRTGIKLSELEKIGEVLLDCTDIEIEGIYSHLATAAFSDTRYVKKQFNRFIKAVELLETKGIKPKIRHICNSAGLLKFPEMHLDMVRAGTILYGQEPAGTSLFHGCLQDAWALKAQITYINELPKGHSIGYERTCVLRRNTKTAIIPIGFIHGFSVEPIPRPRGLFDLIKVLGKTILRFLGYARVSTFVKVKDQKAKVLGKIGMQTTVIDITEIPDVKIGDIVELSGRRTTISLVIPRVYLKNGKPYKIRRIDEKAEDVSATAN